MYTNCSDIVQVRSLRLLSKINKKTDICIRGVVHWPVSIEYYHAFLLFFIPLYMAAVQQYSAHYWVPQSGCCPMASHSANACGTINTCGFVLTEVTPG